MSHFYRKMNAYLCRLKTDRHHFMEIMSRYLKDRQYMWYKVRELQAKGFNKTQIGKCLGLNRKTVRKYLAMNQEEFAGRQASHRKYALKLEKYENYVRSILEEYPWISVARLHDWLRECYPDFPGVCQKTVYNYAGKIRSKYRIDKCREPHRRDYEKLPDTPYGEYAQADFGEKWMRTQEGKAVKVYFFVAVLSRSRYKFVHFSRKPFNTELAVYAHELAFSYFGGKPRKIVYDQDKILLARENLGDLILTKKFQSLVKEQHFQPVFCRKSDPESKGKVENVVKYVKSNFLVARAYHDTDRLNEEVRLWLERTGNGKEHGTTRLVPSEEFVKERTYLMPYYGTPRPPHEEMREYHVRKDNTVQYQGNYYTLPHGTYRNGDTMVWLHETGDKVEIYARETGKLICRHELCRLRGKTIRDRSHSRPKDSGWNLAEQILAHTGGAPGVSLWLERLQEKKERYYRENLKVLVRAVPLYSGSILAEAIGTCLVQGIYNGNSVCSLCEHIYKERSRQDVPIPAGRPDSEIMRTYNEILLAHDKK